MRRHLNGVLFRVLGPLEVFDGTTWVGIGAAKARSLLAALLVRSGSVVSMDRLAFELWGDRPPKSATTQIHSYVMRLRRLVGSRVLITVPPGYRLELSDRDIDVQVFESLAASALQAEPEQAACRYRQALDLWRGPAFADVPPTALVGAEAGRLAERRLTVLEARIDADLAGGRHAALIGELRTYAEEQPLRERPWQQLMLALYRSGRQAEALQCYRHLRRTLVDELGTEPSVELQLLHRQLLGIEPVVPTGIRPVRQLPADIPDFTGRQDALEAVTEMLTSSASDQPPPVVVLCGGPGVGKSTLALRASRSVSGDFPDGQMYLDLAGTSDLPREPTVMLAEVLHALGVTGAGIPDGLQARSTLYRSLVDGRRMLLFLDDAAYADQVRLLLPPTGSCAVIVTSRRLLTDIAGARHLELDVLPPREAQQLFAGIVGVDRVQREPEQVAAVLQSCGYLPLAIRIAGGKLIGRPAWSVQVLRERLDDESRRLGELRLGDVAVRSSFDLSLRALPDDAVRGFRLIGLLGPQLLPGWVLGPLLDRPYADDVLDTLVDANLLRLTGSDVSGRPRYRLHDLLRTYAVEGAVEGAEQIPADERREAIRRVLTSWRDLSLAAADRLPPSPFHPRVAGTVSRLLPDDVVASLTADGIRWFDAERTALLGAIQLAADHGLDELAWSLAAGATPYYDLRSLYEDWQLAHGIALDSVRRAGNGYGEATLLRALGAVQIYRDRYDDAAVNLHRARELFQDAGDKRGEASTAIGLAALHKCLGRDAGGLDWARQALDLAIAAGDQHLEAHILGALGGLNLRLGRTDQARDSFEEALSLSRRLGDAHREAVVLREFSQVQDPEPALAFLEQAADIFDGLDDERCVAYTLLKAGRLHVAQGNRHRAEAVLEPAAGIFARNGSPSEEAKCRQLLGDLAAAASDTPAARRHLTRARDLWLSIGAVDTAATLTTRLHTGLRT